ncbi:MAG TPA: SLBB domain-containing protein [Pyrinomonadaceae bacterium]|nr:SLBB domain-containing protein [Pyrinomonadaceae bacterium]
MKNRILTTLVLFFAFLFTVNGQTSVSQDAVKTDANPEFQGKLIHFGDIIDVDVLGSVEYDWRGKLNPEGFLDGIEFVEEPIYGLCQSEEKVSEAIAKGYAKLLRDPKVVVKILDSSNRALSILDGAVKKSQRFQLKRPTNLNELLIKSGGLTETANGEIRIFRPQNLSCEEKNVEIASTNVSDGSKRQKFVKTSSVNGSQILNIRISDLLSGDKDANPQILSGDVITVLESDPVYVIGGVNNPKQISMRSQLTVSRAIDSAGGASKDALINSITIFRRINRETKIIEVDLEKIKTGLSEDVVLQSFDIIDVSQKGKTKKKIPPVVKTSDFETNKASNLPLTVIE